MKKRKRRVGLHIQGGDRCGNPKNQESGKEKKVRKHFLSSANSGGDKK